MASPPAIHKTEVSPARSSQQVSVSWDEGEDTGTRRTSSRLQFELAECVETKTVTTTTTTKMAYPPLLVRESRPLGLLDSKEYPLANRPTPPELAKFTVNLGDDPYTLLPLDSSFEDAIFKPKQQKPRKYDSKPDAHDAEALDSSDTLIQESPTPISNRHSRPSRKTSGAGARNTAKSYGSIGRNFSRANRPSMASATSERLRRPFGEPRQTEPDLTDGYLATPDTSEMVDTSRRRSPHPDTGHGEPSAESSQQVSLFDAASTHDSDSHTAFSGSAATPPTTEADSAPLGDAGDQSARSFHRSRPTIETVAAQDASLPSPGLSPTLQAAQLHSSQQAEGREDDDEAAPHQLSRQTRSRWAELSDSMLDGDVSAMLDGALKRRDPRKRDGRAAQNIFDAQTMVDTFDALPNDLKSLMMYQFLRRCPRKTLHMVADVVNPALKCDYLRQLPIELSLHILSYLDFRDLCRAAQVSKLWRTIIDGNETGWKVLLDQHGFELPKGELEKAILQGWGWQNPLGSLGREIDLSLQDRLTLTEPELIKTAKPAPAPKLRTSKRKRPLASYGASERSKRRVSTQEALKDDKGTGEIAFKNNEGPIAAATAAVLAVGNPGLGIPSLNRMHLFKSLFRRHYMIQKNWTDPKVKPAHVAFTAHSRNVITCLQFDEDKIITGSDDQKIHVYDTKTGMLRQKLEGHEGGVWALQYEGNTLVSGSTDRSVRVWDMEKGLCTHVFYGHTSTVRCLQILMPTDTGLVKDNEKVMMPPKPLIITGSRDSQLRVWRLPEPGSRRYMQTAPPANDAECPYFLRILQGHTHSVRAISAHGDVLVSGSYDSTVRVWRISTGEQLHVLHGHSQKVYSVVLDHKRNRCISGSMDSLVKIWDLTTGACLYTLEGHNLLVGLLDLRDDRLVSAAADSTLRIWDPENGKCKNILTAHTAAITCFQHDGRKVISGSEKTVKMWDMNTGECVEDLLTDLSGVWQVKFNGRRCVAAVQRDGLTYVEILDFGAVRDGKAPEELGMRVLLNPSEVQRETQRLIEDAEV